MADLTITISNSLVLQGPSPTSKWGTMEWGTDNWGDTQDSYFDITKLLENSYDHSDNYIFDATISYSNSFSVSSAINFCCVTDENGYYYILIGGASDPDNRVFPTYTEVSASDESWTAVTDASNSWSEA